MSGGDGGLAEAAHAEDDRGPCLSRPCTGEQHTRTPCVHLYTLCIQVYTIRTQTHTTYTRVCTTCLLAYTMNT